MDKSQILEEAVRAGDYSVVRWEDLAGQYPGYNLSGVMPGWVAEGPVNYA